MRPIALLAGFALALAAIPASSQVTCQKRAHEATAGAATAAAASGRVGARAPKCAAPGRAGPATHAAPRTASIRAPRYAETSCREAMPSYDASGQVAYWPSRLCGPY